jgi:hypothetical protein
VETDGRGTAGNKNFHIYSDESSQHGGSDYTAIGATFLRNDAAKRLAGVIDKIAASNERFPVREFHWTDMQKVQLQQYLRLVALFMEEVHAKGLRYRCVLIENSKLKHREYSDGDADLGLLKLTFGPIYAFASRFGPFNQYFVYPDKTTTKHPREAMIYALNNRVKTEFKVDCRPFRKVEPTSSDRSRLIQVTDVITGAIAYEKNKRHLAKGSPHKFAVWEHLKQCARLDTLAKPNWGYLSQRFTIRDFDFSKAKPPK